MERDERIVREYLRHMMQWEQAPLNNRQYTAHTIAITEAEKSKSNPHVYRQVKSHLLSNVTCPVDYV